MNAKFVCILLTVAAAIGATESAPPSENEIRPAVGKSIRLLESASVSWFTKQSCVSCHNQALPMMMLTLARDRGVAIDEKSAHELMVKSFGYLADLDRAVQGSYIIDPTMGDAYTLVAGARLGIPRSASTAAYARLIARRQLADGHWLTFDERPPQSCSLFTATAFSLRALQLFLPEEMQTEGRMRVERAKSWLANATPRDTEDRVYQLFGLYWAGASRDLLSKLAERLLSEQRADGGWAQLEYRASDAYATGEVLASLSEAAGVPATHAAYAKGLRYLLGTQQTDGTWHVTTRINPPAPVSPPYFESGLPYGHDQFISAAATAWASIALLRALPEPSRAPAPLEFGELKPANVPAWANTVLFGSASGLRGALDAGFDPNSATSRGTTALMMAAPDSEKVHLLLAHGAAVNATSKTGYTALMLAASHRATDSVRLLLEHNAEVQPPKGHPALFGATPLLFAAWSGDTTSIRELRRRGAQVNATMLLGGFAGVTVLGLASQNGDPVTVKALIESGAEVDEQDRDTGITTLGWAIFKNDLEQARLLLTHNADVNHRDKKGFTPLHWAANIDYGDSDMLKLLLAHGADPTLRNSDGATPGDIAAKYGYARHRALLTESPAHAERR